MTMAKPNILITVIVPPKDSPYPMEAHLSLDTALARLTELPTGTRYACVKLQGLDEEKAESTNCLSLLVFPRLMEAGGVKTAVTVHETTWGGDPKPERHIAGMHERKKKP